MYTYVYICIHIHARARTHKHTRMDVSCMYVYTCGANLIRWVVSMIIV